MGGVIEREYYTIIPYALPEITLPLLAVQRLNVSP